MKSSAIFKKLACLLVFMLAVVLVAACNQDSGPAAGPATPTADVGPMGRFDPPITVTMARMDISSSTINAMPDGDTIHDNAWIRAIYNELGIIVEYDWVVPSDQYDQRFGITIAAGDMPDMIRAHNMTQFRLLLDSDLLADMTDIWANWSTPLTRDIATSDGGFQLSTATFSGRLMGIPSTGSLTDQCSLIWIRQDWLDALNLQRPTTMDELLATAQAFVDADFSGSGTFGFGFQNNLLARGNLESAGFMAGFHAHMGGWLQDGTGNLVFGSIQPEMRNALEAMADAFERGLIDREFGVKNSTMVAEDVAAGRIGITFGAMWNPLFPFNMSRNADPNADWVPLRLVSADARPAMPMVSNPVAFYSVANRNAANPEAVVMIMNLWNEWMFGETPACQETYGGELLHLSPFRMEPATKNLDARTAVVNALETGDTSALDLEQMFYYEHIRVCRLQDILGGRRYDLYITQQKSLYDLHLYFLCDLWPVMPAAHD